MPDVVFVCVREDIQVAEVLAEMFDAAGYSISDANIDDEALRAAGACVIVWSEAASQSSRFMISVRRVLEAGNGVLASLSTLHVRSIGAAPAFDLTRWRGDPNSKLLDPLFAAVQRKVLQARAPAATPSGGDVAERSAA